MFKKDHRVPLQPSGVELYFIFFRIPPSADDTSIIVFVNFLIFHAVAFSFLSSETLKIALSGQLDHLIFTHQSLINDKVTAISQMELMASKTCTFTFTRKIFPDNDGFTDKNCTV